MAISINEVHKTYKGKKVEAVNALRGVSFTLPDTGMVFILGKSGCGKSTLLNVLGGLDGFDGGDIVVDGKSMKGFSAKDYDEYRNNYVGFVFQENNLLEQYTVKRNVALALELQSQNKVDEKIAEALNAVDLKDFAERRCNRLSGGQKQRVAIARALIKKPEMLLCDEPTGSLDSDTGKEIFELLKEISKNTLVVVVSHDRDSAERYGDRVIEIKDGSVLSDSAPVSAESLNYKESKKLKSRGLPAKRVISLGAGYLIARPVRLVLCVLICLITFTTIGIADTINSYDRGTAVFNTMEQLKLQTYTFGKESVEEGKITVYGTNYVRNLSKNDYERLDSYLKVERLDKVYCLDYYRNVDINQIVGTYGGTDKFLLAGFIETDEKFYEDYGFTLYGRVPKNYSEVVVTLNTFKAFVKFSYGEPHTVSNGLNNYIIYENVTEINEIEDLIGKTISVCNSDFKIVGVVDTKISNKTYEDYLYNGKQLTENEQTAFAKDFNAHIHNALYLAKGYHEAVALEKALSEANRFGDKYNADTVDDIKRAISPYNGNKAEKLYNVRVFENHFSYEDSVNVWCFDTDNLATYNIQSVDSLLNVFADVFLYVTIFASLISVLYVVYFTSGIITEKSKEIGILRALGASRGNILKLLCAENGIFASGVIFAASVLSVIGTLIFNNVIAVENGIVATLIAFGIRQFAVLAAVAIGAIAAGIAIPIIRLLRAKPVDIIAGRK